MSEVTWITGMRVAKVSCQMDAVPMDSRAALVLTLENGAIATVNASGDSRFKDRRVRNSIGCTKGSITVEGFGFSTTIEAGEEDPYSFTEAGLPPVAGPVDNFVDAMRRQAEPFSPGEHGTHVVEVIEAAYKSAASGQTVDLRV